MIIACDLDRTLIPNGHEPDDKALERFYQYIHRIDHTLVYVTGRNLDMVQEAYELFGLRVPDYLIASVGTMVYVNQDGELILDPEWKTYVHNNQPAWDRERIISALTTNEHMFLQEQEVQNEFKVSLYADLDLTEEDARAILKETLHTVEGIEIVYSVDPHKRTGLIDILPACATKLGALEYVREKHNEHKDNVIYAGDSGNDILPLTFGYKAIVVKNASDPVKEEVKRKARENNVEDRVYIATGTTKESGNYASGVIEGLQYFTKQAEL